MHGDSSEKYVIQHALKYVIQHALSERCGQNAGSTKKSEDDQRCRQSDSLKNKQTKTGIFLKIIKNDFENDHDYCRFLGT